MVVSESPPWGWGLPVPLVLARFCLDWGLPVPRACDLQGRARARARERTWSFLQFNTRPGCDNPRYFLGWWSRATPDRLAPPQYSTMQYCLDWRSHCRSRQYCAFEPIADRRRGHAVRPSTILAARGSSEANKFHCWRGLCGIGMADYRSAQCIIAA